MNQNLISRTVPTTLTTDVVRRPGAARRTALAVTGVVACVLPVAFAVNISRALLTGAEADHRFHQATGQGLLLCALWLVPLLGLLRAGWSGRRPSTAAGWQHLTLLGVGIVCSVLAPGGGAPALMAVLAVPGALVWAALPQRPRLRVPVQVDPLLAPLALVATAWLAPYAVDQLQAQNAVTGGLHLENPHLFDMAWVTATVMVTGLLAALLPSARHLVWWVAGATALLGGAGLAFGEPTTWSVVTLSLGVSSAVAALATRR